MTRGTLNGMVRALFILLVSSVALSSGLAYGQEQDNRHTSASIQTTKTSYGLTIPFCHYPEFTSDTIGTPPYVPLFPGFEISIAKEKKLAYRWNYSYELSLGVQPMNFTLDVPYHDLDSNRTDATMYHQRVFSLISPYIQPAFQVNRLYEGMNNYAFSFDLGLKAKVYFPIKEDHRYTYSVDSLNEPMIYESSMDYSFSNSFLLIGDVGISVWKILRNGNTTIFSISYSFPFFDNDVGDYAYLPGTRAYSYGNIATSADCWSIGFRYFMAGKGK